MPKYQVEALSAAIRAIRPEATGEQVKAALAELSGEGIREMQGEPPPRAFTRRQVAALLGVSTRTITGYAKRGLLVPLFTGGTGKRAQKYTGESVTALLSGKATVANRKEAAE
ncbi:MAG: MerR family transcriptional regulator [Kiritimatiellae bacterium]|nr:MerR family transcriptional regulator [Kiritimatiellia bacterium]